MAKIIYLEHDGIRHEVEVRSGYSVMEGAVLNNVPGIAAQCGGACACATCHVYLPEASRAVAGERSDNEAAMLEYAVDARSDSRLACQIRVTDAMDGMIVHLPKA